MFLSFVTACSSALVNNDGVIDSAKPQDTTVHNIAASVWDSAIDGARGSTYGLAILFTYLLTYYISHT